MKRSVCSMHIDSHHAGVIGFPVPRQQVRELIGRIVTDHSFDHSAPLSVRFDGIEFTRLDERAGRRLACYRPRRRHRSYCNFRSTKRSKTFVWTASTSSCSRTAEHRALRPWERRASAESRVNPSSVAYSTIRRAFSCSRPASRNSTSAGTIACTSPANWSRSGWLSSSSQPNSNRVASSSAVPMAKGLKFDSFIYQSLAAREYAAAFFPLTSIQLSVRSMHMESQVVYCVGLPVPRKQLSKCWNREVGG